MLRDEILSEYPGNILVKWLIVQSKYSPGNSLFCQGRFSSVFSSGTVSLMERVQILKQWVFTGHIHLKSICTSGGGGCSCCRVMRGLFVVFLILNRGDYLTIIPVFLLCASILKCSNYMSIHTLTLWSRM